jgi:hypothetical protein
MEVDRWAEHFSWSADFQRIIERTAAGCATVEALRLNREHWQDLRWALRSVGCHPPAAG